MRTFALLFASIFSCTVAVAAPFNQPLNASTVGRPIRVDLVNVSGQRRQIRLRSGYLELPVGELVAIDSRVGATMLIVSDMNSSLDERIVVRSGDESRIVCVR